MITVRETVPEDLPALSALFESGFGHALSPLQWEWKYLALPGRARSLVAVDGNGVVTAHVGATGLPAVANGADGLLWQLVDWVSGIGAGLRAPLLDVGRRLLDEVPGPGDLPWVYGFPSERHYRLGRKVFGYRRAGEVRAWSGPLPSSESERVDIEAGDQCGDWVEATWAACGVDGVRRTAAYCNWRYHSRPDRYYRFYRIAGPRADGLVVAAFVAEEAWLTEMWLPPGVAVRPALATVAADLRRAGLARWKLWPPPGDITTQLVDLGLGPTDELFILACQSPADAGDCCSRCSGLHYAMGDYDVA